MRVYSRFVNVRGIRTHYLEAGDGPPLMLIHSGEFGACAELSWERNIVALAKHFHVYAPDMVGFGKTEKLYSFENMRAFRRQHILDFMETLCIGPAPFIGNSFGANLILEAASGLDPVWPVTKIIAVSAGPVLENQARQIMNTYDCTREHMQRILQLLFHGEEWWSGEYLDRRYKLSLEPGAWECTAAARFRSPVAAVPPRPQPDFSRIQVPTLLVAGERDPLTPLEYVKEWAERIPGCRLHVFKHSAHCPHIEEAEAFNELALSFLLE